MPANMLNEPAAAYAIEIIESAYELTPCGQGMALRCLTHQIGGEHEGRMAWLNFTLEHKDERVQEQGQRDFATLRKAVGVLDPADTCELHFKQFYLKGAVLDFRPCESGQ